MTLLTLVVIASNPPVILMEADAAADGISFEGEPDETALKPNPNIPGVPNWEIEDCREM